QYATVNPDATNLDQRWVWGNSGWNASPDLELTLPQTGTYTVQIEAGTCTGSITLELSSRWVTGSLTLDGPPTTVVVARPGPGRQGLVRWHHGSSGAPDGSRCTRLLDQIHDH